MIDIKELRIGSCIGYYKYGFENIIYDTIKSIYFNDEDEAYHFEFDNSHFVHSHLTKEGIEPIPITEELLKQLEFYKYTNFEYGFGFNEYSVILDKYNKDNKKWNIDISDSNHLTVYFRYIQYLHQLQNAIYSGTNEELNIEILLK